MPPLQEVEFSKKRSKKDFAHWISDQLIQTMGDREDLERKWENQIIQWRAQLPDADVDFPFVGAPYSRDTEILTRTGWKRVDEVGVGEYVLTRRDEDAALEWNPVQAKPSVWAPELLHFESRSIDVLCTRAHTMVVENQRRELKRLPAEDLWDKSGYYVPLTGDFSGVDTEELFGLDAGDVAEFVGWYIAEGHGAGKGSIGISQKKPHGRRAIEALLTRLGFEYTKHDSGFTVHVKTVPDQLVSWLDMGWCDEKRIPGFFYGASPRLIKRLLGAMIAGDGTVRYKGDYKPQIHYYTTSPSLADDFQAMAALIGKRASIMSRDRSGSGGVVGGGRQITATKTSYVCSLLHSERAKLKPEHSVEVVEYNDIAYCVTVANHAVYVRRNGKACWSGNSNVEMPLTAIHSDPVYADMLQTLHAPEDYWTPVAKRSDRVEQTSPLREGLTALERRFLKMRRVNQKALLDNNILGTAVYKVHWREERRPKKGYLPDGTIGKRTEFVSQPAIEHVPLQRFYFPGASWTTDPDEPGGTRWQAQEFYLRESKLRVLAEGTENLPGFDREELEKVIKFKTDEIPDVDDEIIEEDDYQPFEYVRIRLFEVWARYDVDGDGIDEDVVAWVHPETVSVLRALHNPHVHGHWPFHVTNYLPSFGIYGIGLSEVDEWAQETMTKLLNAQLDNILLANTRMYQAPLGSNIQPGEPIYPGKIWFVGPNEEVGEVKMSEVYPSIFQGMGQMMQFSEMRSGVSEIRQGNLTGLPSRTPATSLLSILREGNKRFDMILNGIRDVHSEMGLRTLQLVAQHANDDPTRWIQFFRQALGPEDAQHVLTVLSGSAPSIEESFGISVTATSAQVNKEVEKQSFVGLMQIVGQIYQQLVQTAMLMAQVPDPLVQQTARAAYTSGVELLERLLERFDIQNPSQYLNNLEAISQSLQSQQNGQNAALQNLLGSQGLGVLNDARRAPPQNLGQGQIGSILGL